MNGHENAQNALTQTAQANEIATPRTSEEIEQDNQYYESITSLYGVRCYRCSVGCCPDKCFEYGEQDLEEAHHNKMVNCLEGIRAKVRKDRGIINTLLSSERTTSGRRIYIWRAQIFDRRDNTYNAECFIYGANRIWFENLKKIRNGKAMTARRLVVRDYSLIYLQTGARINYDRSQNRHHNAAATKWFKDFSYLDCIRFMMCDYDYTLYKSRLRNNFFN